MPIGPNGEKRSMSPVANAHHIIQVALGIKEEEYASPAELERYAKKTGGKVEFAHSVGPPKKGKRKGKKPTKPAARV